MTENPDTPAEGTEHSGTNEDADTVEEALARGESVRTEIVEHATIESELVDSEVIGREVVGSEVLTEDIVGVALYEERDAEFDVRDDDAFEADDRFYLGETDGYTVGDDAVIAVEVDETRSEIEEVYERKTIETGVVDEDEELEIEIEGVHQHLLDSDLVQVDADEVVLGDVQIEGEFVEDGEAVRSHLTERRTVEREVGERKVLTAAVTDIDSDGGAATTEQIVERELVDVDEIPEIDAELELEVEEDVEVEADADEDVGAVGADAAETTTTAETTAAAELTDGDMGKDAVLPSGEQIGIVSDVQPDANTIYVEPNPGLTDKLKASLHWGDEKDSYPLEGSQIERITEDAVVVESEI